MEMKNKKASDATVTRLSRYYRSLVNMETRGITICSSKDLARRDGVSPAQVRKDLSCFGQFGTRGQGYPVAELREAISRILGLYRTWNVALVGVGYLGVSLLAYREFKAQGFHIVAAFDNDPEKIGKKRRNVTIRDIRTLPRAVKKLNIEMAMVTVPKDAAQAVIDLLVRSGLKMILNFAPVSLRAPAGVMIRNVNIAIELEALSYHLVSGE